MEYVILGTIKIIDNILSTVKSIATYKEKKILSSFLVIISQLIFYLIISEVINDNSLETIILVSVTSGVGNYIAFLIADRFKKDEKWTMILTTKDKEDMLKFSNYLFKNKIKHIANHGLSHQGEETIHIIAFSKTKAESKLIEKYLQKSDSKYLKEII
jgi:uncharacterized protein YebE (UPF0316 family)